MLTHVLPSLAKVRLPGRSISSAALAGLITCLGAQEPPAAAAEGLPQKTARNPSLLETAGQISRWNDRAKPVKIAGPLYFVGTRGLGAWLIETSHEFILLNTGMPKSGPMIEASIRELGKDPSQIKGILACHAHMDHVGGHAYIQSLSGAKVVVMDREAEILKNGGKGEPHYGRRLLLRYDRVRAELVEPLKDKGTVVLGSITLTAHLTPGHSIGATTWAMEIKEGGRTLKVVFPDGTGVNPGFRLGSSPSYPGIVDDYVRTFQILESFDPDIWLPPHLDAFDFEEKLARVPKEGVAVWKEGYEDWVAAQKKKFEDALTKATAKETGVLK